MAVPEAADLPSDAPFHCFAFEAFAGRCLRVALFTGVTNGGGLAAALAAGGVAPAAAFVNASVVVDPFALHLAAHKALAAQAAGRLATRSLHSELLLCLSPGNNISDALRRFGPSASTSSLIVARFDGEEDEAAQAAAHVGRAQRLPLASLGGLVDVAALRKIYKPTAEELGSGSLADAVLSRIGFRELA